jgi:gluconate transporter
VLPGPQLLLLTLASIVLLLILILWLRLHAFLALLLTSMALGIAAGMEPLRVLKSIQNGFGEALGFIAVVVALGAIIGRLVEHSGGGRVLAESMLRLFGPERTVWAVLAAAFLIGLPIFFEVGLVILLPLIYSLAKQSGRSLLYHGLPIACALTVTHAMVPPHPAPAAAAQLLGADLGLTILFGVAYSVPMALSGTLYGLWYARRSHVPVPPHAAAPAQSDGQAPPSAAAVALLLTLPVILIVIGTTVPQAGFFGHPFAALTLTTLLAMLLLGTRRGLTRDAISRLSNDCLAPMGALLAIMGAGGAFKQVIVDTGVGPYAGRLLLDANISPLVLAWAVASAMRVAQGSATVAIITAAGIVAPLVKGIPGYTPEMLVMALCAGGTILSHVNDAGFWLVNQSFGMTVPETLRSWTVMKVITALVGLTLILLVQRFWFAG